MKLQSFIGASLILGLYLIQEKRIPILPKILWAYFIGSALYLAYWPDWIPGYMPEIQNVLSWNACKNLFQLAVFPIVVFTIAPRVRKYIYWALGALIVTDAIWMARSSSVLLNYADSLFIDLPWNILDTRGLIEANTFDAGVIACVLPIYFRKHWFNYIVVAAGVFASVHTLSRTGLLAIALICLIYTCAYLRRKTRLWYLLPVLSCVGALGLVWFYFKLLVRNDRLKIWAGHFDWWIEKANYYFGTGIGSFEWVGLFKDVGFGDTRFYLLHNDWLQILFEGGAIGLLFAIIFYIYVLRKIKRLDHLSIWVSIGATMFLYYPLHAFVIQLVGLLVVSDAIRQPENI